jgi:hypothetical protein
MHSRGNNTLSSGVYIKCISPMHCTNQRPFVNSESRLYEHHHNECSVVGECAARLVLAAGCSCSVTQRCCCAPLWLTLDPDSTVPASTSQWQCTFIRRVRPLEVQSLSHPDHAVPRGKGAHRERNEKTSVCTTWCLVCLRFATWYLDAIYYAVLDFVHDEPQWPKLVSKRPADWLAREMRP